MSCHCQPGWFESANGPQMRLSEVRLVGSYERTVSTSAQHVVEQRVDVADPVVRVLGQLGLHDRRRGRRQHHRQLRSTYGTALMKSRSSFE